MAGFPVINTIKIAFNKPVSINNRLTYTTEESDGSGGWLTPVENTIMTLPEGTDSIPEETGGQTTFYLMLDIYETEEGLYRFTFPAGFRKSLDETEETPYLQFEAYIESN